MADSPVEMLDIEEIMHTTTPPPLEVKPASRQPEFVQGSSSRPMNSSMPSMGPPMLGLDDRADSLEPEVAQSEQLVRQAATIAELQQQRAYLVQRMAEERARWDAEREQFARSTEALHAQFQRHKAQSQENGMSYREMELTHALSAVQSQNAMYKQLVHALGRQLGAVHKELEQLRPFLLGGTRPSEAPGLPPPGHGSNMNGIPSGARGVKRKRKQGTAPSAQNVLTNTPNRTVKDSVHVHIPPITSESEDADIEPDSDDASEVVLPSSRTTHEVPDRTGEERKHGPISLNAETMSGTPARRRPPKEARGKGKKAQTENMNFHDLVDNGMLSDALAKLEEPGVSQRSPDKEKDKDLKKGRNHGDRVKTEEGEEVKAEGEAKHRDKKRVIRKLAGNTLLSDARAEHLLIAARKIGRERAWQIVQREHQRLERERKAHEDVLHQGMRSAAPSPQEPPRTPTAKRGRGGLSMQTSSPHAAYYYMVPAPGSVSHSPSSQPSVSNRSPGQGQTPLMFIPMQVTPGMVGMSPYSHLVSPRTPHGPGSPSPFRPNSSTIRQGPATPHIQNHITPSTQQRHTQPFPAQTPRPKTAGSTAPPTPFDSLINAIDRARREEDASKEAGTSSSRKRRSEDDGSGTDIEDGNDGDLKPRGEMSALDVLADQAASASKNRERERERILGQDREGSPTPTRTKPRLAFEDQEPHLEIGVDPDGGRRKLDFHRASSKG